MKKSLILLLALTACSDHKKKYEIGQCFYRRIDVGEIRDVLKLGVLIKFKSVTRLSYRDFNTMAAEYKEVDCIADKYNIE